MSTLAARAITVRRGGHPILQDVSAELAPGMFVALVGANGAGKSTLLAALAGLLKPEAGEAILDGAPVLSIERRRLARLRAYIPQNPHVEWPISVERLVALGLTPQLPAFGGLAGGYEPRLTRALEACDLAEHRFQPATTLSGGELARAMLARALIGEPQVLLADEPMAGLDPRHALDTVIRLRRLAVDDGRLVVAAAHELTLVARYATHLMVLRKGRLLAFGPVAQVLSPALLGEAFEVEARVSGAGREVSIDYLAVRR